MKDHKGQKKDSRPQKKQKKEKKKNQRNDFFVFFLKTSNIRELLYIGSVNMWLSNNATQFPM